MATRSQFKVTTRTQWKYEKHVLGKKKKKKGCQIYVKESAVHMHATMVALPLQQLYQPGGI
jgi:hypothetical protein